MIADKVLPLKTYNNTKILPRNSNQKKPNAYVAKILDDVIFC